MFISNSISTYSSELPRRQQALQVTRIQYPHILQLLIRVIVTNRFLMVRHFRFRCLFIIRQEFCSNWLADHWVPAGRHIAFARGYFNHAISENISTFTHSRDSEGVCLSTVPETSCRFSLLLLYPLGGPHLRSSLHPLKCFL